MAGWSTFGRRSGREARRLSEQALGRHNPSSTLARVTTLSTLTASIWHEVNQPLSGIITNASTCLRMLARTRRMSTARAKPHGGRSADATCV